jgi:hypothetical protein
MSRRATCRHCKQRVVKHIDRNGTIVIVHNANTKCIVDEQPQTEQPLLTTE